MAATPIASNLTANGDSTPVLITPLMRNTYGEVILAIFGDFDGATVQAKVSRDAGGTDALALGALSTLVQAGGISLNVPSKDDLYLFLTVTGAGPSTDVGAEVYS